MFKFLEAKMNQDLTKKPLCEGNSLKVFSLIYNDQVYKIVSEKKQKLYRYAHSLNCTNIF